ncbi:hypothetical protein KY386_01680, partial [Candidatus Parcubacteria bacterium]|nr:hypothetical protein [Candidatus Parcubacteria bacterium]
VDAPIHQRYERAKDRRRLDHVMSVDEFRRQELAEEGKSATDSQITTVISSADFDIANDATLEDLHAKVDSVLERFAGASTKEPS